MRLCYVGLDLMLPALDTLIAEGVEIDRIFTCPVDNVYEFNTGIISRAKERGIPYTLDRITADDITKLRDSGCDGLICGAYYYKIPVLPDFPMINIHPALLPVGRGSWPMPVTILKGLPMSGVTFHKIAESYDTGDIILQKKFDVSPDENLETFTKKFQSLLPEMIRELTADLPDLWDNATPQGDGEYWRCPTDADATVTEDMSGEECDRILRAFYGFECFYEGGGKRYSILRGRYSPVPEDNSIPACGGYIKADKICEINSPRM